jgi:hypothetical protein
MGQEAAARARRVYWREVMGAGFGRRVESAGVLGGGADAVRGGAVGVVQPDEPAGH